MNNRSFFSFAIAAIALLTSGCEVHIGSEPEPPQPEQVQPIPYRLVKSREVPVMNLPVDARMRNYSGGSCVCASTISALRWQGRDDLATKLRGICSGGQSPSSLHHHLDRLGIRYAYTVTGDVKFLEWACRTRRGCGIGYFSNHYINLVHLDKREAWLMDNNHPKDFIRVPREDFVRRWRGYGGWATAVVYLPAPPRPYHVPTNHHNPG